VLVLAHTTLNVFFQEPNTTPHHRQPHQRLLALKHFTQRHICHFGTQSLYLNLITLSHFMRKLSIERL
jgi:hypothetical protein